MSKYRDELAAARARITAADAKLFESEALLAEKDAEIAKLQGAIEAKDEELAELRAELERLARLVPEDQKDAAARPQQLGRARARLVGVIVGLLGVLGLAAGFLLARTSAPPATVASAPPLPEPPTPLGGASEPAPPAVPVPEPPAELLADCGCGPEDLKCQLRCASTPLQAPSAEVDRSAVLDALGAAQKQAQRCGADAGPGARAQVTVTFASDGTVRTVVLGEPWAGTAVEPCLVAAFESAKIPPFDGSDLVVRKSFNLGSD